MTSNTAPAGSSSLKAVGIAKSFGGKAVLREVSVEFHAGEIHAVLGENGAGKSTLMNLILGIHHADAGHFEFKNEGVDLSTPRAAAALGIGMVHQHFKLVENISGTDNLLLGHGGGFFLDRAALKKELMDRFADAARGLDLDLPVSRLGVAAKQRLEILKALLVARSFLILDEPTAIATPAEVETLYRDLRAMAAQGLGVIIVTHKLEEVLEHADRVSVLQAGRVSLSKPVRETSRQSLADAIVGGAFHPAARPAVKPGCGEALHVRMEAWIHPETGKRFAGGSLILKRGLISGVAGVAGQGQEEWFHRLAGDPAYASIALKMEGAGNASCRDLREKGLRFVPGERHSEGLFLDESLLFNMALGSPGDGRFWQRGLIQPESARKACTQAAAALATRYNSLDEKASTLSGGNQQKILLARELMQEASGAALPLLMALDPSRGVDISAQQKIHEILRSEAAAGRAVLVYSHDLDELAELCDELWVLFEGRMIGPHPPNLPKAQIGGLMSSGALLS